MDKKYKTRKGLEVRLLCVDRKGYDCPVVGLVHKGGSEDLCSWTSTGLLNSDGDPSAYDLIEVPPVYLEPWKWYKQGDNAYCTAPNKDSRYIDIYSCQYGGVHLYNHRISELTPLSKILPGAVEISQPKETK
jgi:hypothetical protein